jgi:hypothetical protein
MTSLVKMSNITEPFRFLERYNLEDDSTFELYCSRLEDAYKLHTMYETVEYSLADLVVDDIEGVPQRYVDKLAEYVLMCGRKDEIERKKVAELKRLNLEIKQAKQKFDYKLIILISKRDDIDASIDKGFKCYSCGQLIKNCRFETYDMCSSIYSRYEEEEQQRHELIIYQFNKYRN